MNVKIFLLLIFLYGASATCGYFRQRHPLAVHGKGRLPTRPGNSIRFPSLGILGRLGLSRAKRGLFLFDSVGTTSPEAFSGSGSDALVDGTQADASAGSSRSELNASSNTITDQTGERSGSELSGLAGSSSSSESSGSSDSSTSSASNSSSLIGSVTSGPSKLIGRLQENLSISKILLRIVTFPFTIIKMAVSTTAFVQQLPFTIVLWVFSILGRGAWYVARIII